MDHLEQRPIVIAIAGPNGAGKSTFFYSQLAGAGLRFINADELAADLSLDAYAAARVADALRRQLLQAGESFVFETVFSDPVGDKLALLQEMAHSGYTVVLCFIGLDDVEQSEGRVAMRVTQGGHDVPYEKLVGRFPRTLKNLREAIAVLPHVYVYDNSDLRRPYRQVAVFEKGTASQLNEPLPAWLQGLV